MTSSGEPEVCALCDAQKRTGFNSRAAGGWVCIACYHRELAPRRPCSVCGLRTPVSAWSGRRGVGRAFCVACYQKHVHLARCSQCGKKKPIQTRAADGSLCIDCYDALVRKKEPCAGCGIRNRVYARTPEGKALCRPCHRVRTAPTERCFVCRRLAFAVAREEWGPICQPCYDRRKVGPCVYCRRTMKIARRTRDGRPVCGTCAARRFTPLQRCVACREEKRTRRRTSEGKPLCDACYMRQSRSLH
jgi:hypothetical protein